MKLELIFEKRVIPRHGLPWKADSAVGTDAMPKTESALRLQYNPTTEHLSAFCAKV